MRGLDVALVLADAFNLPLNVTKKFDVIHIDSVLHHLIGKTRGESFRLVERMLEGLMDRISTNGLLIVKEVYYGSYLFSRITSFLVFNGLKPTNTLGLDLSFTKEIRPGLEVNFLHKEQLNQMLNMHGSISLLNREIWEPPRSYRIFLLKREDISHTLW